MADKQAKNDESGADSAAASEEGSQEQSQGATKDLNAEPEQEDNEAGTEEIESDAISEAISALENLGSAIQALMDSEGEAVEADLGALAEQLRAIADAISAKPVEEPEGSPEPGEEPKPEPPAAPSEKVPKPAPEKDVHPDLKTIHRFSQDLPPGETAVVCYQEITP